ncbi:YqhG family protein [Cohnella ginsengisoli]|uniref:YqhG family protein n=1 Tax=Cohnella ginsengisoli TaxID=425004 RepID=A0A9X4KDP3_9BACL|nr:YqhG family protein [Cohnella ginsengisoli]MDG0789985.1 YqhG family protein [Cohnella ginsengisoli]
MNARQVEKFVMSYLEATGCDIIEKAKGSVTVRLSPEADKRLTNRPYYWGFVERTGTPPETLTFGWQFGRDDDEAGEVEKEQTAPDPQEAAASGLSPLGFGVAPVRVLREDLYFGSGRLAQIFGAVRDGGRCVAMFEEPPRGRADRLGSNPYTAWLGVNFKVDYECDMKREEMYGWGISLATGYIEERFLEGLRGRKLTPKLPSNVHLLPNGLSLKKAMSQLEQALERKLKSGDFSWAAEAEDRRQDELRRIRSYYDPMIGRAVTDEEKENLSQRLAQRESEIDWQYRPRVTLSVMNCGLFHLPGIH